MAKLKVTGIMKVIFGQAASNFNSQIRKMSSFILLMMLFKLIHKNMGSMKMEINLVTITSKDIWLIQKQIIISLKKFALN